MAQLAFDLGFEPRFGADDFLVAPPNSAAHAYLARWPDWQGPVTILSGPEGSGKSHLAAIWAAASGARLLAAGPSAKGAFLSSGGEALLLEDADRTLRSEADLFHLLNWVKEQSLSLLITARGPADRWGIGLPDLLSRLRLATPLHIAAPDEDLLRAVLVKLFVDQQLSVDSGVVDYLARHLERSLGAARRIVDALDRASLATNRRITRAAAAAALDVDADQA